MRQRKIAIFSALYMPHLGGVEKFSQSLAAELSKDSQVTVFCMNTEKQPDFIQEGSVSVHFLPCFSPWEGRFPIPKLSALRAVYKYLRQDPPDFAIVQCRFYPLSYYACLLLHRFKIPFIQIDHGAGDLVVANPIVNWVWHRYDAFVTNSEKKLPHEFYGVSHAGLRWLEHYGIRGSGVISNSINPNDFTEALRTPDKWRKAHGIPNEAILITFCGRIMREKGILDLLEAFSRLRGDNLYLAVAGGGDMELIKPWRENEKILFTGQIDFHEVTELLAGTQIYCLPSRFIEGKPTSVLEAGYCRNAGVSSNSGGTTEIIPDENYGILVPSGDTDALTEALQSLIDDPEKRKQMGENLHQRIMENFTWEKAAQTVSGIIDKTL